MDKRLIAAAATVGAAAVVVGLSAAATTSSRPERALEPEKGKAASGAAIPGQPQGGPVVRSQSNPDVRSYWTLQRMRDAQPIEKTVLAERPSARSRSPKTVPHTAQPPASVPDRTTAPRKKAAKKTSAAGPAAGPTSATAIGNAADYWTKDRMDSAQPPNNTVPGSGGGNSSGSSDDGDEVVAVAP